MKSRSWKNGLKTFKAAILIRACLKFIKIRCQHTEYERGLNGGKVLVAFEVKYQKSGKMPDMLVHDKFWNDDVVEKLKTLFEDPKRKTTRRFVISKPLQPSVWRRGSHT